jgi:hypothetical protein
MMRIRFEPAARHRTRRGRLGRAPATTGRWDGERGSGGASLGFILLMPVVLLLIFGGVQFGLHSYARSLAVAAAQAVAMIGFPEAALTLAHATIALALAPKSNSATLAIGAALEDVRKGLAGPVPPHLRDGHYQGAARLGHAQGYVYPHDVPGAIAAQQYAPDALKDRRYYEPTRYGAESRYADVVERVRERLRGAPAPTRAREREREEPREP